MKTTIAQFIPIVLAFVMLSYIKPFVAFSHTILGKLLAVLIIIFYTHMDKIVGLFVCALVILFYQFDYVENMLNMGEDGAVETEIIDQENGPDILCDEIYLTDNDANAKRKPPTIAAEDKYVEYDKVYTDNESTQLINAAKKEFQQANCRNGRLMHKNLNVHNEMADHVFPMVQFPSNKCNVCNDSCAYNIIDANNK
jgi:hypothetical protein